MKEQTSIITGAPVAGWTIHNFDHVATDEEVIEKLVELGALRSVITGRDLPNKQRYIWTGGKEYEGEMYIARERDFEQQEELDSDDPTTNY